MGNLVLLGMGVVIVVYESKKENIFPASFIMILISSAITSTVVFVLTQNLVVSLLIVGLTIFEIVLHGLLSKQSYGRYSKHLLLKAVVSISLAIILYQSLGINGILLGYFIGSILVLTELCSLMKNRKIEFSVLKPKIKFTIQAYFTRLSEVLFSYGDKLMIGSMFGFLMLGNYFFAAQYLFLMDAIPRSIAQYLLPQESEGKKNKKIKILSVIMAIFIVIISIIFVPVGVKAFFPKFEESIILIQIMSLAIIPTAIYQIQITEFFGKENSRVVMIGSVTQAGLFLLLVLILGQSFSLIGIAVGLVISAVFRTIFNLIANQYLSKKSGT
jgi:O-antigen/teichoic acid export membrane protein